RHASVVNDAGAQHCGLMQHEGHRSARVPRIQVARTKRCKIALRVDPYSERLAARELQTHRSVGIRDDALIGVSVQVAKRHFFCLSRHSPNLDPRSANRLLAGGDDTRRGGRESMEEDLQSVTAHLLDLVLERRESV